MGDGLRAAVERVLPGVRADLEELIRIPSVSADPGAAGEVRRSAELTARLFAGAGARVRILDDVPGGAPAVLAHCPGPPGAPRVLLYAHHDVQPAGRGAWTSPPFEPTERGGRLYGRGAADDKAGVAAHLATVRAYAGRPPVDLTVFVEGEEEIGSPTLGAFLDRYRADLDAEVILLADSSNFTAGRPSFTASLRGMAACTVRVSTLAHGVHSGRYGGGAPDSLTALCRLLATLHDERGDVAVEGLTTGPPPPTDFPEERYRAEAGVLDGVELIGTGRLAERLWSRPAALVLAIDATPVAEVSDTLIPTARAKVSLRLAPGDDPVRAGAALARHLREHAPWGVRVEVEVSDLAPSCRVSTTGPLFEAARAAYRDAYGADVDIVGGGGTIPFVDQFATAFPDATLLIASAGPDLACRAHSHDESLPLDDFARACLAQVLLLCYLGGDDPPGPPRESSLARGALPPDS